MANYDLRSSLQNSQQAADVLATKTLGAQQIAQNFVNGYMSPALLSDLHNRLGVVIATTADTVSVADFSFPPFNQEVTLPNLGVRVGGFKQLNDKINQIQNVYRLLTGEIRTKITEWDISLYLQQLWLDQTSIFDLSLLYRIFVDNPSGYTDSRALCYGILNAALNFQYKDSTYNPTADPDLYYWVSPTADLSAYQVVPKGHFVTTGGGGWWIFSSPSKTTWVWDVPPPDPVNAWQQGQINIANAGGWTSWTPPFWQLFFTTDNTTGITTDDISAILDHLKDLANARTTSAPTPQVQPSPSLFSAPGAPQSQLGINLASPIWYGYPYGRFPDPRSVQGYIDNTNGAISKIDVTGDSTTGINKSYPYGNPMDGIDKLFNGWVSTYDVTTYIEKLVETFTPEPYSNSSHNNNPAGGYFTQTIISVPSVSQQTTSGEFPSVTGVLGVPYSSLRAITEKAYGYLGAQTQTGNGGGRGGGSLSAESYGAQQVNQNINIADVLQIADFNGSNAAAVKNILADGVARPVILVGTKQGSANKPAFVVIAPIQRVQTIVQSSHTAHFLLWAYTATTISRQWVYQLDMTQGQGFSIDTGANNIVVANPMLPMQYFKNGAVFTGVYFDLPKRTLTANENIITDGWGTTSIDSITGAAIATALLNPMWWNGTVYNRSPLDAILQALVTNVFGVISDTLSTLSTLFQPGSAAIIENIISQLPTVGPNIQGKQTIQTAKLTFSNTSTGLLLSQVENSQNTFTTLLTAINNIISSGAYTVEDIQTFYQLYPIVMGGLLSPTLVQALRDYLNILYEQRMVLLSSRINKTNGTLITPARLELILGLMQDELAAIPNPAAPLILANLPVVHDVTNVTLLQAATTAATELPTEVVQIVYVLVQYTDSGDIIRPPAGTYQLYSQEMINQPLLTAPEWYITFEESSPNCPSIIKNIITAIDGNKLQQIMTDTNLTQLEKICFARTLADWWEIPVPTEIQPLATRYQSNLMLIQPQPDAIIEQYITMTGSLSLNPVLESTTNMQLGSTWAADPAAQKILAQKNGIV